MTDGARGITERRPRPPLGCYRPRWRSDTDFPRDPHDDQGASGGLVTIDEVHEVLGIVFVPENRGQAAKARAHCPERAGGRKAGGAAAGRAHACAGGAQAHFLLEEAPAAAT